MSATIKNVVKIAPKPILNSPGTAGSSNATAGSKIAQIGDGKYVVIQNSKGVQIPLKVVTQQKTVTTSQTTTTTNNIQIVKAPSTVLVKPSTSVATKDGTQTFQISSSNNQGITGTTKTKFIVKAGTNQQVILTTPSTITQADAKKTVVAPASSIMIGMKDGSPTMKLEKEGSSTSESSVLKIVSQPTQSQTPNIHAINIPGKGVKFVKILNSASSSSHSTVLTTSTSQIQQKTQQITTKLTPIASTSKPSQLFIKNKDGKTVTVVPQKTIQTAAPTVTKTAETTPEIKTETVKKHALEITGKSPDEPPQKKTKFITLTSAQINQIQGVTIMQKESKKIVMLPANYAEQLEKLKNTSASSASPSTNATTTAPPKTTFTIKQVGTSVSTSSANSSLKIEKAEPDEAAETGDDDSKKKKRACNCTKSMCLKFYCDCFANGEFCQNCNCKDCLNLEDCPDREKAIKLCLEKNPLAFKPKIASDLDDMQRLHVKGCNCKRSGCLKNYCECYEAKISCSSNCKCLGCKNCDDASEKLQMELNYLKTVGKRGSMSDDSVTDVKIVSIKKDPHTEVVDVEITKKPYNFMTQDVIEATVQCMIAQAEECQKLAVSKKMSEKLILEEFGRCLVEIIEFSNKNVQ